MPTNFLRIPNLKGFQVFEFRPSYSTQGSSSTLSPYVRIELHGRGRGSRLLTIGRSKSTLSTLDFLQKMYENARNASKRMLRNSSENVRKSLFYEKLSNS